MQKSWTEARNWTEKYPEDPPLGFLWSSLPCCHVSSLYLLSSLPILIECIQDPISFLLNSPEKIDRSCPTAPYRDLISVYLLLAVSRITRRHALRFRSLCFIILLQSDLCSSSCLRHNHFHTMSLNWTNLIRFISEEDGRIHLGEINTKKYPDIGLTVLSGESVAVKLVKGSIFDGVVTETTMHVGRVRALNH